MPNTASRLQSFVWRVIYVVMNCRSFGFVVISSFLRTREKPARPSRSFYVEQDVPGEFRYTVGGPRFEHGRFQCAGRLRSGTPGGRTDGRERRRRQLRRVVCEMGAGKRPSPAACKRQGRTDSRASCVPDGRGQSRHVVRRNNIKRARLAPVF